MDLTIDPDELNMCVQCGLCLPSCPTFRVTGDETRSPRGRIALMRAVQNDDAPLTPEVLEAFDTCVQCRGCEPACPSGVPYGHLMERTREALADDGSLTPVWQRWALKPLNQPRLLQIGTTAMAVAQRLKVLPDRLGAPADLPLRHHALAPSATVDAPGRETVFLFTGCVMDVWQSKVHAAAQRVLEAADVAVIPTNRLAPCCGALHTHAGLGDDARARAEQLIGALPERPILVDSAGCGAAMKDYGHLLDTEAAREFSARVFDIQEWLAPRVDQLPQVDKVPVRVAVQDPCHLRHVQRVHEATRTVLAPFVQTLVELDDDGLCCGAGGAYSVLQPELAGLIRERKVEAIDRARPDLVASANPGCSMHLAGAGVRTIHPMQLIDAAISKTPL
ncbi:MAG: heterodisulfide reductase-related iron-sulfur binding cluster [Actinomycetota bacterium]|nr:heterodisulfide reductase-related iron-sulfur binding cluster [Actinomycetota bacterium]